MNTLRLVESIAFWILIASIALFYILKPFEKHDSKWLFAIMCISGFISAVLGTVRSGINDYWGSYVFGLVLSVIWMAVIYKHYISEEE